MLFISCSFITINTFFATFYMILLVVLGHIYNYTILVIQNKFTQFVNNNMSRILLNNDIWIWLTKYFVIGQLLFTQQHNNTNKCIGLTHDIKEALNLSTWTSIQWNHCVLCLWRYQLIRWKSTLKWKKTRHLGSVIDFMFFLLDLVQQAIYGWLP